MNKRHYEHTLPNIRGSLSNTYCPSLVFYAVKHLLFYPFFDSSLCLNRSGILQMRNTAADRASYGGFPGQLRFHGKEEFAGNALQAAGSSMAADLCIWQTGRYRQRGDRNRPVNMMVKREYGFACINAGEAK